MDSLRAAPIMTAIARRRIAGLAQPCPALPPSRRAGRHGERETRPPSPPEARGHEARLPKPAGGADGASSPAGGAHLLDDAGEPAERLNTVGAYRAFIRRFPGSFEAELAQGHIDKLEGKSEPLVVSGCDPEPCEL